MFRTIDEILGLNTSKYVKVRFRDMFDFPTNYATHDLYPYPAKFIPHVVRFFLSKYTDKGDLVFDPFAGSGTVAIESEMLGRDYLVWDLNPLIEIFVRAETWKESPDFSIDLDYDKVFTPKWRMLDYWHPKEFVEALGRLWGFYHDNPNPLVAIVLLKVTKFFSYAELEFPKLYKSRLAKERVKQLLSSDWRSLLKSMILEESDHVRQKVLEFQSKAKGSRGEVKGGVDSLNSPLPSFDVMITSPPYLQAQEYIRTFKLGLFWLGYDDSQVRALERKEIPYNNPPPVKVESDIYDEYLEKVQGLGRPSLVRIYTSYFHSLVSFLNRVDCRVMGLFVGPVKMRHFRVPIDEILREHLETRGWRHEVTYIDTIVSRRIKKVDVNPATGLSDERTPTEHLLVMSK